LEHECKQTKAATVPTNDVTESRTKSWLYKKLKTFALSLNIFFKRYLCGFCPDGHVGSTNWPLGDAA